jgi:hypothetical protein
MKYEFAVAHAYHMSGGRVEDIDEERFSSYQEAQEYARTFLEYCEPAIYIIVDNEYVFYCHYMEVFEDIPWVYSIQSMPWGQVETRIWWKKLEENPKGFYHLAQGRLKE